MKIKLSNTSKMPCKSWGIPATACKVGAKLAKAKGSVCESCYAFKGAYSWPVVKNAYQVRLDQFNENHNEWILSMIKTLNRQKVDTFRWFDSGDLQSIEMLEAIVSIAFRVPQIRFWLPTRERQILQRYIKTWGADMIPSNLTIRLSDYYIDQNSAPIESKNIYQSGVVTDPSKATCLAPSQNGECKDCRQCWDKGARVNYLKH